MESIITAIAIMIVQKAFEKAGEKLGEQVLQESAKLLSILRMKSPQTASAIESALEQPSNYHQTVIEVEALSEEDPEFAKAVSELVAVASEESNIRLMAPIRELVSSLREQELSTQSFGVLSEKIGVAVQGGSA
jgi:beta-phosphoglucomutase-like phosphatase (HAD superfamily)